MKIILLGYMGAGKSTIGRLLSEKLALPFEDLDHLIEKREQMTINSLFTQKGEIYFRKIEHEIFQELIASPESFVLALGGGTPCYADNHLLLRGDGIVSFYLKASVDSLLERLEGEKDSRPLLLNREREELKDYIAQHLFERSYYYHQATHILNTDGKVPEDIVGAIETLLV